ncbi:MAG: hypothetical protein J6W06_07950 [Bacteroidales bacterium]|nr:hypothetical protein [Bacteroidales bacterium]
MNGDNKFLKLFYIIAFIAFACVSCWATAESLHMLLPTWPLFAVYIITIGFFVIASLGTKMIVDSFNPNIIYLGKRGLRLTGGVIIVLVFWLVCSMPTNTHTFFYRSVANGIAKQDIMTTIVYLTQLENDTKIETSITDSLTNFNNRIKSKVSELESEIRNEANPGDGTKSQDIREQIAKLLDVPKVEKLSCPHNPTKTQRDKLVEEYRSKIYDMAEGKSDAIRNSMLAADRDMYKMSAKKAKISLDSISEQMNNNPSLLNEASFAHEIDNHLLTAYAIIKNYSKYIDFNSKSDREIYMANNPVTNIKRLMSVFDVWKDMFKGLYKGHGFFFWILISVLVDIAAFIFFDLAFKKED